MNSVDKLEPRTVYHDSPAAIAAGITLAVVGVAYFMAAPAIVGALSEHTNFSEQQAGILTATESVGGLVASLLVSISLSRFDRRRLAVAAIVVALAANLSLTQDIGFYSTAIYRAISGLGSGAMYALGLASLSASQHTARNYSILLFVQVSFGMAEIHLFGWLAENNGMSGIYLFMSLAFTACLGVVHLIPRSAPETTSLQGGEMPRHTVFPWACLFAVFLFYLGIGGLWTYIERIGIGGGLAPQTVTDGLTYTQILSLLGCALAGWLTMKLGQLRPLIISLVCIAGASYSLTFNMTSLSFTTALCTFFLFWNAVDIYQLGTLGSLDHGGRFVAMVPAFQTTAMIVGPAIAALLLGMGDGYRPVLLMTTSAAAAASLIYVFVHLRLIRAESLQT